MILVTKEMVIIVSIMTSAQRGMTFVLLEQSALIMTVLTTVNVLQMHADNMEHVGIYLAVSQLVIVTISTGKNGSTRSLES